MKAKGVCLFGSNVHLVMLEANASVSVVRRQQGGCRLLVSLGSVQASRLTDVVSRVSIKCFEGSHVGNKTLELPLICIKVCILALGGFLSFVTQSFCQQTARVDSTTTSLRFVTWFIYLQHLFTSVAT